MSRSSSRSRWSAPLAPLLLTALLALAVVLVRLTLESRAALRRADARRDDGAAAEAVAHYLDAARAHYPGNPYASDALDRLLGLAEAAPHGTPAGDDEARTALEAFRAAVLATRSVYVPRERDLAQANERLADIYARWETRVRRSSPGKAGAGGELAQRRQWHLQKLSAIPGPSLLWSLVALFGMAVWLAAVVAFITRALTPNMKIIRGPALGAGLAFVCGLALFLLGLSR